ncbi:MAG TPA: Rieske 2Fe-2S domain-containing protein [Novosphingobium sp.]|nr:Rieske 2Fe-2S domain-containing protein [Novosphingobium sp.]HZV10384.1 Rieske 2Fe-2S domain-containing protein [Novosphingobium sp.]
MSDLRIALATLDADGITCIAGPAGAALVVCLVEGAYYVTDDLCSHGDASLAEGWLEGFDLVCPYHSGAFDVRTGAASRAPCALPVRSYAVRREGEELVIGPAQG